MKQFLDNIKSINTVDGALTLLFSKTKKTQSLEKALSYTIDKHKNQFRKSGEDYVVHPILVACVCIYFEAKEDIIISALLHDVVEDTPTKIDEISSIFGNNIAKIVEGLTKISKIRQEDKNINSAMSFEKMMIASSDDVRVLFIKLCDRLHNLLTLEHLKPEKQKRIARESINVYASIAHKLGMHRLKNHLEDLSFKFLFPKEFETIDNYINKNYQTIELKLNSFVQKVETMLLKNGFILGSFKIEKRVKHYYSIFLKMQRKGIEIDEVLDLFAIRLLIQETNNCYLALGVLHQNFKPLFGRFKDYVALPKDNGYQTIHTTLFDNNSVIEVQIRTFEMNKSAKFGIAAHWKYKNIALSPDLSWISRLKDNSTKSIEEFYELCKNELYIEEVQIFTPNGDMITLPRGSVGLDFAYAVHNDVGDKTQVIYVNNKRVPLLTLLESGDIVRVETSSVSIIRCTWVAQVRTSKAKKGITKLCKTREKKINKEISTKLFCNIFDIEEKEVEELMKIEKIFNKSDTILNDLQFFQSSIAKLKKHLSLVKKLTRKIKLKTYENIGIATNKKIKQLSFSQCCNPKKGDLISAIYENGTVHIHNKLCPKFSELLIDSKTVFVQWNEGHRNKYKIIASLEDKVGSLASLLNFLTKHKINLINLNHNSEDTSKHNYFEITIDTEDKTVEQFKQKLLQKYKIIEFVSLTDAFNSK